jgi:hypothetical protein
LRQLCIDGKIDGAYKIADGRKWLIPRAAIEQLQKGDKRPQAAEQIDRQVSLQDPLIIEARKKHLEDIFGVIRMWKDELWNEESWGPLPFHVDSDKYKSGPQCVWPWGRPGFQPKPDGVVKVWFSFERHFLFEALKAHLVGDKELWEWWDQVKQALSQGVERELKQQHLRVEQILVPTEVSDLVPKILKRLDFWLNKGVLPGKCPLCDYDQPYGNYPSGNVSPL